MVKRRVRGLIKIYGGGNEGLNGVVRGWLESAGYMYYPCKPTDRVSCMMKFELGGKEGDVVVQRGKKSMVVDGDYDKVRQDIYEYLNVAERDRGK